MYLQFYKFREFPFAIGCDERFFYESPIHTEALAGMMYIVQQRKGMVLVSGEVGAGKTFASAVLASRLGASCQCVLLKSPPANGKQLLRALGLRLGLTLRPQADKLSLTEELEAHLLRLQSRGRLVALLLDEAQDLSTGALEELRLLWNWECGGQRLIQIVLIGQPELRQKLLLPRWEPLRQRVVLSCHLGNLSQADIEPYIAHRIAVASESTPEVAFSPEAAQAIHRATGGIPRMINVLCDNSLLVAYSRENRLVEVAIVEEVVRDMTCWSARPPAAPAQMAGAC